LIIQIAEKLQKKNPSFQFRFGGEYPGNNWISVGNETDSAKGTFQSKVSLPRIGKAERRISLRPGLVKFFEGITVANAQNDSGIPLTTEKELWPFKPFAWTTEDVSPPRPFILYYDPPLHPDSTGPGDGLSPGPIVLHGGFTSAFEHFTDDESGGTGRLMISIACWLVRMEERSLGLSTGNVVKTNPFLSKKY
jgi:hypothetical protein